MAREALADADVVKQITENFIPVLIDFDKEKEWSQARGVTNLPMIQWTDSTGEVMSFTAEEQPKAQVLSDMKDALEIIAEFADEE
jgi:hypothetical protein